MTSLRGYVSRRSFELGLTGLFLIVATFSASHHEMGHDELQAWLISRDSHSLPELLHHLKYEGHPVLWYLLLMPLSRAFTSPTAMQVLHVLIAATTVFVFATLSPFSRLQKVFFAFGYYSLYEYSVVPRSYALGLLLLCIVCALFSQRRRSIVWLGIALVLLAHTSVHAAIVAIAISGGLLLEYLLSPVPHSPRQTYWAWLGFGLIALGVLAVAAQLSPAPDAATVTPWVTTFDAERARLVSKLIAAGFLPLPEPGPNWWPNLRWLDGIPYFGVFQFLFSVTIVGWCGAGLIRKPAAFFIFAGGTLGLLVFFYVIQTAFSNAGAIRHHGFLYLAFLATAWIQRSCTPWGESKITGSLYRYWVKSMAPVMTAILAIQVVGGAVATASDVRYVFSNGKQTAQFIIAHGLRGLPMVGEYDMAAVTVIGYLGTKGMYYPRGKRFGSFVVFDKARGEFLPGADGPTPEELVNSARHIRSSAQQPVLLVLTERLPREIVAQSSLVELAAFTEGGMSWEHHFLYLLPAG